jgi:uncharacterized phage protein gp47/JayE
MIEIPTHPELYALGKSAALLRSSKLSEASFSPGYMLDILVGLDAALAQEICQLALELHRRTFVRTAEGTALDALAEDHYSLPRRQGSAAIGKVKFLRSSAAAGPILIEIGTRVATDDGFVFYTSDPAVLSGLSVVVDVQAATTGVAGNLQPGKITQIVDALDDSSITVSSNSAPANERMAGGSEPETDEEYRARIRGYLATLRRGTVAALAYGAQISGVSQATVDDTTYPPTVYVADPSGSANTTLRDAVAAELVNWRAAGVQVNVLSATAVNQAVALALSFAAGVDTSATRDAVIAAVVREINTLTIGETLFRSSLIAAAKVPGVVNVVVSNPAGDVVPAKDQLIRTSAALVTL